MTRPISQPPCNHEVAFAAALDHAAVCKWCGAIMLISPHGAVSPQSKIEWVSPQDSGKGGTTGARTSR